MPVELVETRNGSKPVAMRFGKDILTIENIANCAQYGHEPHSKACIVGAIECGLLDKNTFLALNPRYTHETLEVWKAMNDVVKILQEARDSQPQKIKPRFVLVQSDATDSFDMEKTVPEKKYTVGDLTLYMSRNSLQYKTKTHVFAPCMVRALELLFCNPGQFVTNGVLYRALRNKPIRGNDATIGAVFHDLQKIMEVIGGPHIPIEASEDGNSYRLKRPT